MILKSKWRFAKEIRIIILLLLGIAIYTGFVFSQPTRTTEKKVERLVTHESICQETIIWYEVAKDGVNTIQFHFKGKVW